MKKIIVVDDEKEIVSSLTNYLKLLGFECLGFASANEALDYFKKNTNDISLLITDLTMPEMTGDILIKEIKKIKPQVYVILCSGYNPGYSLTEMKSFGVSEFIPKPFEYRNIIELIKKSEEQNISN